MESLPAALAGLVASDSPEDLVERLTVAAGLACGLPGVLYLYDGDADAYYPAAGLGGDTPAGDLPRGSAAGLALTWQDQPLGLLQLAQTADPAASALLAAVLPHAAKSVRLGITGVPGVGKSTLLHILGFFSRKQFIYGGFKQTQPPIEMGFIDRQMSMFVEYVSGIACFSQHRKRPK
jgi:hypothetical protein